MSDVAALRVRVGGLLDIWPQESLSTAYTCRICVGICDKFAF